MNIFKKYKLWWLIAAAIVWADLLNSVIYAFTGVSFLTPTDAGQAVMLIVVFIGAGIVLLCGLIGGAHKRSKP